MKNIFILLLSFYCFQGFSQTITATISYQGYDESQAYFGEGEYEIFLDNVDGVLDKPIIVIDGFDPGDGRNIPALYAALDFAKAPFAFAKEALAIARPAFAFANAFEVYRYKSTVPFEPKI